MARRDREQTENRMSGRVWVARYIREPTLDMKAVRCREDKRSVVRDAADGVSSDDSMGVIGRRVVSTSYLDMSSWTYPG